MTHIPSESKRSEEGRKLQARMGLKTGLPDFWLIDPQGRNYYIELKRGRLGVVSEGQQEFGDLCRSRGIPYALCRSFNEAADQLQAWGAIRPGTHYW